MKMLQRNIVVMHGIYQIMNHDRSSTRLLLLRGNRDDMSGILSSSTLPLIIIISKTRHDDGMQ